MAGVQEETEEAKTEEEMKKLKYVLKWVAIGIIIWSMIAALIYLLCPCKANAADLKCVTIKFKNDSELKLKAQWFVNAPVTKINCRWLMAPAGNYEAMTAWYKERGRQIRESPEYREHGYFELYSCDTLLFDRTLLFPPDVRKEPVIKTKESKDGKGWIIMAGESVPYDTTKGEALLWYEERKKK